MKRLLPLLLLSCSNNPKPAPVYDSFYSDAKIIELVTNDEGHEYIYYKGGLTHIPNCKYCYEYSHSNIME